MAAVRIEEDAFASIKMDALAEIAGYNRYEALGRMAHLWRLCTDKQTYIATERMVINCLGPNGMDAIVQSELGEVVDGGVRVKGTKGRIEWIAAKRQASAAGGEANRIRLEAMREPDGIHDQAERQPNDSPLTLAHALPVSPADPGKQKPASRAKPKVPYPDVFVPRRDILNQRFDYATESAQFRDHHLARGSVMADWNAAWRTWCANALKFQRAGPGGSTQVALDVLRELEEDERRRK
jgi:hypothetical protein